MFTFRFSGVPSFNLDAVFEELDRALLRMALEMSGVTRSKFLTDPERMVLRSPVTGRRYVPQWYYRRQRALYGRNAPIGVVSGLLRNSFGPSAGATRPTAYSVWRRFQTRSSLGVEFGTKVNYAERLTRIRYDFAKRGADWWVDHRMDAFVDNLEDRIARRLI